MRASAQRRASTRPSAHTSALRGLLLLAALAFVASGVVAVPIQPPLILGTRHGCGPALVPSVEGSGDPVVYANLTGTVVDGSPVRWSVPAGASAYGPGGVVWRVRRDVGVVASAPQVRYRLSLSKIASGTWYDAALRERDTGKACGSMATTTSTAGNATVAPQAGAPRSSCCRAGTEREYAVERQPQPLAAYSASDAPAEPAVALTISVPGAGLSDELQLVCGGSDTGSPAGCALSSPARAPGAPVCLTALTQATRASSFMGSASDLALVSRRDGSVAEGAAVLPRALLGSGASRRLGISQESLEACIGLNTAALASKDLQVPNCPADGIFARCMTLLGAQTPASAAQDALSQLQLADMPTSSIAFPWPDTSTNCSATADLDPENSSGTVDAACPAVGAAAITLHGLLALPQSALAAFPSFVRPAIARAGPYVPVQPCTGAPAGCANATVHVDVRNDGNATGPVGVALDACRFVAATGATLSDGADGALLGAWSAEATSVAPGGGLRYLFAVVGESASFGGELGTVSGVECAARMSVAGFEVASELTFFSFASAQDFPGQPSSGFVAAPNATLPALGLPTAPPRPTATAAASTQPAPSTPSPTAWLASFARPSVLTTIQTTLPSLTANRSVTIADRASALARELGSLLDDAAVSVRVKRYRVVLTAAGTWALSTTLQVSQGDDVGHCAGEDSIAALLSGLRANDTVESALTAPAAGDGLAARTRDVAARARRLSQLAERGAYTVISSPLGIPALPDMACSEQASCGAHGVALGCDCACRPPYSTVGDSGTCAANTTALAARVTVDRDSGEGETARLEDELTLSDWIGPIGVVSGIASAIGISAIGVSGYLRWRAARDGKRKESAVEQTSDGGDDDASGERDDPRRSMDSDDLIDADPAWRTGQTYAEEVVEPGQVPAWDGNPLTYTAFFRPGRDGNLPTFGGPDPGVPLRGEERPWAAGDPGGDDGASFSSFLGAAPRGGSASLDGTLWHTGQGFASSGLATLREGGAEGSDGENDALRELMEMEPAPGNPFA